MSALAIIRLPQSRRAAWPVAELPRVVSLLGKRFVRSSGLSEHEGTVAHYREDVARNSAPAYVLRDGTYVIDHLDEHIPDHGAVLAHFWRDVVLAGSTGAA